MGRAVQRCLPPTIYLRRPTPMRSKFFYLASAVHQAVVTLLSSVPYAVGQVQVSPCAWRRSVDSCWAGVLAA